MNLSVEIENLISNFQRSGRKVMPERWQAQDVSENPQALMVEQLHVTLRATLPNFNGGINLKPYQFMCQPNLPWADDHFMERICGVPLNPGVEYLNWPWSGYASSSQIKTLFNHNYMERYWPKFAGVFKNPISTVQEFKEKLKDVDGMISPTYGLKNQYGDLEDVIDLLANEPTTRQAYMPIWFPEDTGSQNKGRKPCTLGYHFIMRNGKFDIRYDIRSCDLRRHFRDDVYMTIRLGIHILEECKKRNPYLWSEVTMGEFIMHITSLHMFIADYQYMFKGNPHG